MPSHLPLTTLAVAEWDAVQPALDALWESAQTNEDVYACQAADEAARLKVGEAFYQDTKDFNQPWVAKVIGPRDPWLRRQLGGVT